MCSIITNYTLYYCPNLGQRIIVYDVFKTTGSLAWRLLLFIKRLKNSTPKNLTGDYIHHMKIKLLLAWFSFFLRNVYHCSGMFMRKLWAANLEARCSPLPESSKVRQCWVCRVHLGNITWCCSCCHLNQGNMYRKVVTEYEGLSLTVVIRKKLW